MDSPFLTFITYFNLIMFLLFAVLYSYKFVYIYIAFRAKRKKEAVKRKVRIHNYAAIIAARNEELVIGELIKSIKNQNYPEDCVDIFVVADNCTDQTAKVAKRAGAIVRERFNKLLVGKGYALDYMIKIIEQEYAANQYDGYLIFDADNLLDENYIAEMNKTFNRGYRVVTSYRNSKNYGQNWITAGYSLWFLHEAEYLNLPRMVLKTSCAISGTGFLVHANLIKQNGGWIHHLLTEDIEFSVHQILKGETIGYCKHAIFYDEQPATLPQSWNQRLRWAKGFYQVLGKYGRDLIKSIFFGKSNRFSCYDMTMTIMPALLISLFSLFVNGVFYVNAVFEVIDEKGFVQAMNIVMLKSLIGYYG
ncbi:glycosyltransferase family 2 protein [Salirhabdus sp. Marseille-P4669]|uniref:glycosyltransferase family 2 protein n=1 Tax=Salirhabdus sp. Marseille-P4669 TaxID=2042310 RepID=UPI00190E96D1|nr:glycosyltransferase family 2 protein [Salirhabdus sp. Marseille-P4669]